MRCFIFIILFISLFSTQAYAFEGSDPIRPKIGLVLSGGGAKGAAHVGILKVLEQNKVPIDYVVGTSIGAYVGGLYALGYSAEEIENIMLGLPWNDSYSDFIPREDLLFEDKKLRDQYNISIRLGYSENRFKMPKGLLLGQTVSQLLQQSTDLIGIFLDENGFDQLAVPYRAVASDLVTAKPVVLSSGSLYQVMKASAAVPGVVAAVNIGGQLLVDGGITNNMPIDVVKAMGADIVIAVDIGSPLTKQSELDSAISVINQLSTILTNNTSLEQKKLLTKQDIILRPAIDDLGTTDFSIMGEALQLGKQVALEHLDEIQKLAVDEVTYQDYIAKKVEKSNKWFNQITQPIIDIQYKNFSKVSEGIIAEHFDISIGDTITQTELRSAIDRVYALDRFEQVNAEFVDGITGRTLILTTQEKSWGPNYLNFGFSLQSDISHKTLVALDAGYTLSDITANGGLWINELSVGWEPMLATEFYQPLTKQHNYFFRSRAEVGHDKWEATKDRPEIRDEYLYGGLSLGANYSNNGVAEVGFIGERGDLSTDELPDKYDYYSYGGFASLAYDDLNSTNFPTQGNKLNLDIFWRQDVYDPLLNEERSEKSVQIKLNWRGALGIGSHTFVGISSFAAVLTDNEREDDFTIHVSELGGFLNLSGYQQDALIGAHKAFVAAVYQYDLGSEVPGAFGLPLYLGTSLEVGKIWDIQETVKLNDLISSASFYVGTDTSFGPAVLGLGVASDGEHTLFLSLGKNW